MSSLRFNAEILLLCLLAFSARAVLAQEYPVKPIHIMTGSIGGGNDSVSRLIAPALSASLGQPVIVDNRPPLIATETAAKFAPDGYNLLVHGGAVWILPLLQKVSYDVQRDFAPLTQISRDAFILAVHPSVPVKSVKELIALAKAKPGQLNYSATSPGGSVSLSGALLKSMAGINIVAVPYTGNGPALTGLLSGETQLMVLEVGLIMPHVKSGKLKALGVTSAEPSALAPGMPTVAATGLAGYEAVGMTVMFVPAKTPPAIIARLNQEVVRFLNRPEVKERFLNAGSEVVASTPEQFAATMKADFARWEKVIKDLGLKVN